MRRSFAGILLTIVPESPLTFTKNTHTLGEAAWTTDEELGKLIEQFEKPADQTLYFIKQTDESYIFTSDKREPGKPYIDIHGIPKGLGAFDAGPIVSILFSRISHVPHNPFQQVICDVSHHTGNNWG
jgi:hypothetical protein